MPKIGLKTYRSILSSPGGRKQALHPKKEGAGMPRSKHMTIRRFLLATEQEVGEWAAVRCYSAVGRVDTWGERD